MNYKDVLRRHLATLAFRVRHALKGIPIGFEDFDAGMGARTPEQVVNHINTLLAASIQGYRGQKMHGVEALPWAEAVEEFHALLQQYDKALESSEPPDEDTVLRIYQGPMCDAMTHVGQLMMLRRLSGVPVQGANYYRAEIQTGHLGPDQKVPA